MICDGYEQATVVETVSCYRNILRLPFSRVSLRLPYVQIQSDYVQHYS